MHKIIELEYLSVLDNKFDSDYMEEPTYVVPNDIHVEIGDIVLVERYEGAVTIGQVKDIHEVNNISGYLRVFNVLDVLTNSCTTFQQQYNEVAKKRIQKEIDERIRQLDKMRVYEEYAKHDDELRQLLDEFKAMGGTIE